MFNYSAVEQLPRLLIPQLKPALFPTKDIAIWNGRGQGRGEVIVSHKASEERKGKVSVKSLRIAATQDEQKQPFKPETL